MKYYTIIKNDVFKTILVMWENKYIDILNLKSPQQNWSLLSNIYIYIYENLKINTPKNLAIIISNT